MSLLTPDLGILFWMVISFTIVFVIMAKFGFPVITKSVNERREYIQQSLSKADEANRMLENIRQQSEETLNETHKRQLDIIKQATVEAERIIRKAKDDAVIQGKQKMDEMVRLIELQKQKAAGEIRSQVAMLSVTVAEKILRHQLDNDENHDRLVSLFLDEIETSDTIKN
jgi:F-type H+-transporting ATPase subunit b